MKKIYLLSTTVIISIFWQPMILSMLSKITKNMAPQKTKKQRLEKPKQSKANASRHKKIRLFYDKLAWIASNLTDDEIFKEKFNKKMITDAAVIQHCIDESKQRMFQPSNN